MILKKVLDLSFVTFVLLLPIIESRVSDNDGTIVQLEPGKIQGHILKSENGNDYYAFQEIPYAASPVGGNRFQLPKSPPAWSGVLDTTRNTKICYQAIKKYANLEISEDCLYINVYTPQKPGSDSLLPVLLWIHGGGLRNESSTYEYYGPKYIMDHGVVVVTFNYRLGAFGFVGTDDQVIPLNLGLKDQRFAIEWVNKNIHLFGGNPNQVTLVGESAGSISTGYHLMGPWTDDKPTMCYLQKYPERRHPDARAFANLKERKFVNQMCHSIQFNDLISVELFHAVIMQSGDPISGLNTQQHATENAINLGRAVDKSFSSKNTTELLQVLQNAAAADILAADITGGVVLEQDGPFSLIGFQSFLDGNYKKVPIITGFNSEEWLYIALMKNESLLESLDADPSQLINKLVNMSPENKKIAGNLLKQLYTDNTSFVEEFGGYIRFVTDQLFITSASKHVELTSLDVPTYFYQFSYKGVIGGQMSWLPIIPPGTGTVAHAEDLHYMWDDGSNSDLSKFSEEDQLMLHRYVKLWTNFVKYFNPTPEEDPLLDNFTWLPSEPKSLRYMNFNSTLEMREHPRQYQQVKAILEKYMEPPYNVFG